MSGDRPRPEQILLELRDASSSARRSFDRLIDFPELITDMPVGDDSKDLAARYVTQAREALSRAMNSLDAAYDKLGGDR
ncbi:hypothetical protein ACQPXH_33235 (plasmid) [Nocardia sp. CA-135953]|uniref:hypothetical protein n=1 Tax=Nocardia sp. CA-135953 TaxID=3239978 RepID=UPI003D990B93